MGRSAGFEDAAQHLLGRRLADAAGHGDDAPGEARARRRADGRQSGQRVVHVQKRCIVGHIRRVPIDQRPGGAGAERRGHEQMPILVLAMQGDEQVAHGHRPRIDRDALGGEGPGHEPAGSRGEILRRPERAHAGIPTSRRITVTSSKGSVSRPMVWPCS